MSELQTLMSHLSPEMLSTRLQNGGVHARCHGRVRYVQKAKCVWPKPLSRRNSLTVILGSCFLASGFMASHGTYHMQCHASHATEKLWRTRQDQIKSQIRHLLADLTATKGPAAPLLPGQEAEKAKIDELIRQLQENAVCPDAPPKVTPRAESVDPRVLGEWELVYASNGTVSST